MGVGVGATVAVAVAVAVAVTVGVAVAVAVAVGDGVGDVHGPVPCGQVVLNVQDTFKPADKLAVLQEKVEKSVGPPDPVPFCRATVAESPVPFKTP